MGFYFASQESWSLSEGYTPTITAREYVDALTDAQETLIGVWGWRCRLPAQFIADAEPEAAIKLLEEVVRRAPSHEHARCLLGLAHLVRGDDGSAVRHLEVAFDVAQRKLRSASALGEALRRQCQAALMRLLLLRLRIKVGRVDAAKALLEDGHVQPRAGRALGKGDVRPARAARHRGRTDHHHHVRRAAPALHGPRGDVLDPESTGPFPGEDRRPVTSRMPA